MATDISEKGLETIIFRYMTGEDGLTNQPATPAQKPKSNGSGYFAGHKEDFDREYAVDATQLFAFLCASQPKEFAKLGIFTSSDPQNHERQKFLKRLADELKKRGIVDVLRNGVKHEQADLELFYAPPTEGNKTVTQLYAQNRFSLTRQLAYDKNQKQRSLDLCLFVNGLPLLTFELKNQLTNQNADDAVHQYCSDRDSKQPIFIPGRCAAHFALDDSEVKMCAELKGNDSVFLPFNKGYNNGAGNPPNPEGIKTDYLWQEILTPDSVCDIVCNYAQSIPPSKRNEHRQHIWPRYHQLDAVRLLLTDVRNNGVGRRYLIQHSPGSGKSNTIAWLAYQLQQCGVFDSVIVATDRRILDNQLTDTIKVFRQRSGVFKHADNSQKLRQLIINGSRLIVTTVQKFPYIVDALETQGDKQFAVIVDEAHSGQGGKTTEAMNTVLGKSPNTLSSDETEKDPEDVVNEELGRRMSARKMLENTSYFAFTATPKNKTLEIFGEKQEAVEDGKTPFHPFHLYAMKQAVEEKFILDVLTHYTPVSTYSRIVQTAEDSNFFDVKKATKALLRYVERHKNTITIKIEVIGEHFHNQVWGKKIGGEARAMVVCESVKSALDYYHALNRYLKENNRPYKALIAFSGEQQYNDKTCSEASINGFSSTLIAEKFRQNPYRFLICADKFQTGYDEPLLHTMYVNKKLSGVRTVQTLSRLNRTHPQKVDCFVLDFQNTSEEIACAFQSYYSTTILSDATDPNKLHDQKAKLDAAGVYSLEGHVERVVNIHLCDEPRNHLDPVLDECVNLYKKLSDDKKTQFKKDIESFCRAYNFLGTVLPYSYVEWEKLSIFLCLLAPKLPAVSEDDFVWKIKNLVDMKNYLTEKKRMINIRLSEEGGIIDPFNVKNDNTRMESDKDWLENIVREFNERFSKNFNDPDSVVNRINNIAEKVANSESYKNARKNTPQNAPEELKSVLGDIMVNMYNDDMTLSSQYLDNEDFQDFLRKFVQQYIDRAFNE